MLFLGNTIPMYRFPGCTKPGKSYQGIVFPRISFSWYTGAIPPEGLDYFVLRTNFPKAVPSHLNNSSITEDNSRTVDHKALSSKWPGNVTNCNSKNKNIVHATGNGSVAS